MRFDNMRRNAIIRSPEYRRTFHSGERRSGVVVSTGRIGLRSGNSFLLLFLLRRGAKPEKKGQKREGRVEGQEIVNNHNIQQWRAGMIVGRIIGRRTRVGTQEGLHRDGEEWGIMSIIVRA